MTNSLDFELSEQTKRELEQWNYAVKLHIAELEKKKKRCRNKLKIKVINLYIKAISGDIDAVKEITKIIGE